MKEPCASLEQWLGGELLQPEGVILREDLGVGVMRNNKTQILI